MSKLKKEGVLSTEGLEKGYYGLAEEFDEWLDYAVSVNDNILLKYYEVKFVVGDAPPEKHL